MDTLLCLVFAFLFSFVLIKTLINYIDKHDAKIFFKYNKNKTDISQDEIKDLLSIFDINEDFSKYSFLPMKYPELLEYYKDLKKSSWVPEELDLMNDRNDWDKMTEAQRQPVQFILFLFAQLDGLVAENLVERFKKDTSMLKECRAFYAAQEYNEWIHNETYSNLIDVFIRDEELKKKGLNSIKHYESIKLIASWCKKFMRKEFPLNKRILVFACIEGIIFSAAFAVVYYIKKLNILTGLTKANEWIARDEGVHTRFAVALYWILVKLGIIVELTTDEVYYIVDYSVRLASYLMNDALKVHLLGLDKEDMIIYIKCVADSMCVAFGKPKLYNLKNKLEWMAIISLPNKTNFFEGKVTEYQKNNDDDFEFSTTEEF
jgi:ribonucleotide reductase beta subunit family protein with ferritin-like domain